MSEHRPPPNDPDASPPAGVAPDSGPTDVVGSGAAGAGGDGTNATHLAAGAKVGSRFVVEAPLRADELGAVYAAKDEKTGRTVALRVMDAALAPGEEALGALRAQVKAAAAVQHKNIAATYGMGRAGAYIYVAGEHVDGTALRVLLERKRESGKPFSVKGAYNVVAHACNALAALPGGVHGRLGVDTVQVQRNGRVKLADVGLGAGTVGFPRKGGFQAALAPFLAPEMLAGAGAVAPTAAGDVYALGVILFELLVGRPPRPGEALSSARPDVPVAADEVVGAALAPDPAARPAGAAAFKNAVQAAFGAALTAEESDSAHESRPAAAVADPAGAASSGAGAAPAGNVGGGAAVATATSAPKVGTRIKGDAPLRPGVVAGEPVAVGFKVDDVLPLDENIEKQERWLVCKGNEDWGPFSAEELRNQVRKLRVTEFDMIEDRETTDRFVLNEIPYFAPFLVKWRPERAKQIEEEKRLAVIRRARNIKLSIAGSIVAGILAVIGAVAYIIYGPKHVKDLDEVYALDGAAVVRKLAANMSDDPTESLKAAAGKLPKELLKVALAKRKGSGKARKKWASGYDDSETISLSVSDDDSDDDGAIGGEPLTGADLMSGWNAAFPEVKKCLLGEAGRSGKHSFVVRFTVQPNGSTKGIRLSGHSGTAGETCVKAALSTAKFPTNSVATPIDWPVKI
jgi:hypothetical protein